jgi:hypothetical protein
MTTDMHHLLYISYLKEKVYFTPSTMGMGLVYPFNYETV